MRAILAAGLMLASSSALAEERAADRHLATSLRHQLRVDPDNRAAMVNLAREYRKAGETRKAERLYRQLLAMEDMTLERAGGAPVSAHWLADQALRQSASPARLRMSSRN